MGASDDSTTPYRRKGRPIDLNRIWIDRTQASCGMDARGQASSAISASTAQIHMGTDGEGKVNRRLLLSATPLLQCHDVVAAIDVDDLAGYTPRHIREKEQRRIGDFGLIYVAAKRGAISHMFEYL